MARKRVALFRNVLTAALALFLTIAVVAVWQGIEAVHQRKEAKLQAEEVLAKRLAARAHVELNQKPHSLPLSTLLSIEAAKRSESLESKSALRQMLELLPRRVGSFSAGEGNFSAAKFSEGGQTLLALGPNVAHLCQTGQNVLCVPIQLQESRSWESFSRDGARVAALDQDGFFRVWSTSDGRTLFTSPQEPCETPDFSHARFAFRPNGSALFTACGDHINVRNIENGELARISVGRPVAALHFSDAGHLVVVARNQLEIRDANTGNLLRSFGLAVELGDEFETALDPAGKYFAVLKRITAHLSERFSEIHVWDFPSGQKVYEREEFVPAGFLSFSPSGTLLAASFARSSHQTEPRVIVRVFDITEKREVMTAQHLEQVSAIAFSGNEEYVATASEDKTAIVWHLAQKRRVAIMSHDGIVRAAVFDEHNLLHTFSDGIVHTWEATGGEVLAEFQHEWRDPDQLDEILHGMAFNHEQRLFSSYGFYSGLFVWSADSRIRHVDVERAENPKVFYWEGRCLSAEVLADNTVSIVDLLSGKTMAELPHDARPTIIDFSKDGQYLVTIADRALRMWNLRSRTAVGIATLVDPVWTDDSPIWESELQGRTLAVIQRGGSFLIDFERGLSVPIVSDPIALALSPDGSRLAVLSARNGEVLLSLRDRPDWKESTSQKVRVNANVELWGGLRLRFFLDGTRLALFGSDDDFRVLQVPNLEEIPSFGEGGKVQEIDFNADQTLLVTVSLEGTVLVWDSQEATIRSRLKHDGAANSVKFFGEGKYVLLGGYRTASVWEWSNQREVWRAEHRGGITHLVASPDGKYIATASQPAIREAVVQLRIWRTDDLIKEACGRLTRNMSEDEWHRYVGAGSPGKTCQERPESPQRVKQVPMTAVVTQERVLQAPSSVSSTAITKASLINDMIFMALENDNQKLLELRDQILALPNPSRGNRKTARSLNSQGLSYFKASQYGEAVQAFQQAARLDPGDVEIVNNLGYALLEARRLQEAEDALIKALSLAPDRTSGWANLGQTYAIMGKADQAVGCFTNAYRFSHNAQTTKEFFKNLAENGSDQNVRESAEKTLALIYVEGGDAEYRTPQGSSRTRASPAESADIPGVNVGDTYVVESEYSQNAKLNNTTERKVISVIDGEIIVASRNVRSTSSRSRKLRFTREWNLVSSRNADGSGLDYSPPLKYFDFPLYPGKTWRQTSIERNIKTGATREFTLSASVGDWENVSVPAGTFRAIRITTQTELLDGVTGQRSTGTDVSWYAPDIRRSVKSLVSSRNMQGNVEEQFIHMAHYELK
ncbi:MAG: tetratricopeptide repeat protein [Nitrospiraceae bacterium]|nr:tetratricopeptide repeat protein [Nitrospiraceae bacterium]